VLLEFVCGTRMATKSTPCWSNRCRPWANRLEATAWNRAENQPIDTVTGLPWINVVSPRGEFLTSSRREAHRLASAHIRKAKLDGKSMGEVIATRLDLPSTPKDRRPLNYTLMAAEISKLDPFRLVHGVWFSHGDWYGQPSFTRAVCPL
jgi:CRISPR-associated protein Csb1